MLQLWRAGRRGGAIGRAALGMREQEHRGEGTVRQGGHLQRRPVTCTHRAALPHHHCLPGFLTAPQIDGDWRYDMRKSCLVWSIELIDDTNRTGSAEFVVPAAPSDAFFPIEVRSLSKKLNALSRVSRVCGGRCAA